MRRVALALAIVVGVVVAPGSAPADDDHSCGGSPTAECESFQARSPFLLRRFQRFIEENAIPDDAIVSVVPIRLPGGRPGYHIGFYWNR